MEKLLERGELRAEPLTEGVNNAEKEPDAFQAVWDPRGALNSVRTSQTVPMPGDPEQLRARICLFGVAWQYVAYQQTNREYLRGLGIQLWQAYLSYLLGDCVFGLAAKTSRGEAVAAPPWELVLSYELQSRRAMMEKVLDGGHHGVCAQRGTAGPHHQREVLHYSPRRGWSSPASGSTP